MPTFEAEAIRHSEYPTLQGQIYLDHAGMTPYSSSTMEDFQAAMCSGLYGNPHSESPSSKLSTQLVEDVRTRAMAFFNASPDEFDLVFVQNATAGVKVITEILHHSLSLKQDDGPVEVLKTGFWYGYHSESHTSAIGARQLAKDSSFCFRDDQSVEQWLHTGIMGHGHDRIAPYGPGDVGLFSYPGQSNMTGRRLPLSWPRTLRLSDLSAHQNVYSLLDAAALASTAPLDLGDANSAPDFTVVSFLKIFGFPDLGGLIVRREAASILANRKRYFGGGTVEMVVNASETPWHSMKRRHPHEYLEDGTPPVHNIIALGCALNAHLRIYTSQKNVSEHVTHLAARLCEGLSGLQHGNGTPVCVIYKQKSTDYRDSSTQGPIISFNIRDATGQWLRLSQLDAAASEANIHLRTGDVCNPGGVAHVLNLAPWESLRNFAAGIRCGCKNIVIGGKPSGVARVSLGAMSTMGDVEGFVRFIESHFCDVGENGVLLPSIRASKQARELHTFVNTLIVYPILGCAGWLVPSDTPWEVCTTGLRCDRDWCIIDTNKKIALTQDAIPQLALVRPEIDTSLGVLKFRIHHSLRQTVLDEDEEAWIPLQHSDDVDDTQQVLYGDSMVAVTVYNVQPLKTFLSKAMRRPCTLARFKDCGAVIQEDILDSINDTITVCNSSENQRPPITCLKNTVTPSLDLTTIKGPVVRQTRGPSSAAAKSQLRPPQEVLAESMGANIVLAPKREIMKPSLDGHWTFVNLGKQYTETTDDAKGSGLGSEGLENGVTRVYNVARVSCDTLPWENLRSEVPKHRKGLKKIKFFKGHDHCSDGLFEVTKCQQWDFS